MSLVSSKRIVSIAATSLPSYVPTSAGQIRTVSNNFISSVYPPNPYQGANLGFPNSGMFVQGMAILNKYYGPHGAMIAQGLCGHLSHYTGNEAYIFQFTDSVATNNWVRWTNPYPDPNDQIDYTTWVNYDQVHGEYLPQPYFGQSTSDDHTRGAQICVPGGTNNRGYLFYPKTGTEMGSTPQGVQTGWSHLFDCGLEIGMPSYDITKPWWTRSTNEGPAHGYGGSCWYQDETPGIIYYISTLSTAQQRNVINRFDIATRTWISAQSMSPSIWVGIDDASDYISSRKLLVRSAEVIPDNGRSGIALIDRSGGLPSPAKKMTTWIVPPFSNQTPKDWRAACKANVIKYCPDDGKFYLMGTNNAYFGTTPQLWRYTAPFNFSDLNVSNATIMAEATTQQAQSWVDITSQLNGDPLQQYPSQVGLWGPYQSFEWHEEFHCFAWVSGPNAPVQLIRPQGLP